MARGVNTGLVRRFLEASLCEGASEGIHCDSLSGASFLTGLSEASYLVLFTAEAIGNARQYKSHERFQAEACSAYLKYLKCIGKSSALADQQNRLGIRLYMPAIVSTGESDIVLSLMTRKDLVGPPVKASRCTSVLTRAGCLGLEAGISGRGPEWAYLAAYDNAQITHTNLEDLLSCGFYGAFIASLVNNVTVAKSIKEALGLAERAGSAFELIAGIKSLSGFLSRDPGSQDMSRLGSGLGCQSLLLQSLYCVLKASVSRSSQDLSSKLPGNKLHRTMIINQIESICSDENDGESAPSIKILANLIGSWSLPASDDA